MLFPNEMRTIPDFQELHRWFDDLKGFGADIQFNFVLLTGEVGEVAQVLKRRNVDRTWTAPLPPDPR